MAEPPIPAVPEAFAWFLPAAEEPRSWLPSSGSSMVRSFAGCRGLPTLRRCPGNSAAAAAVALVLKARGEEYPAAAGTALPIFLLHHLFSSSFSSSFSRSSSSSSSSSSSPYGAAHVVDGEDSWVAALREAEGKDVKAARTNSGGARRRHGLPTTQRAWPTGCCWTGSENGVYISEKSSWMEAPNLLGLSTETFDENNDNEASGVAYRAPRHQRGRQALHPGLA